VRHRLVELCAIGALGFYLFCRYQLLDKPFPDFAPDFSDASYGQYGRRDWWSHYLFPGRSDKEEMSYQSKLSLLCFVLHIDKLS
jgi:hypothetical protein